MQGLFSHRQFDRLRRISPPRCRDLLPQHPASLRSTRSRDLRPADTRTSVGCTKTPSESGTRRRRGAAKPSSSVLTSPEMLESNEGVPEVMKRRSQSLLRGARRRACAIQSSTLPDALDREAGVHPFPTPRMNPARNGGSPGSGVVKLGIGGGEAAPRIEHQPAKYPRLKASWGISNQRMIVAAHCIGQRPVTRYRAEKRFKRRPRTTLGWGALAPTAVVSGDMDYRKQR
jgi:hypothetical protein